METTTGTKKTRNRADDEGSLILFVIRLLQLKGKRYRWSSPVQEHSVGLSGGSTLSYITIRPGTPDSDELVSYLSVVRQFWLKNEPTNHSNIAAILIDVARDLQDTAMQIRIEKLCLDFSNRFNGGSYSFAQGQDKVELSHVELVNFWFSTFYFHADLRRLGAARLILTHDSIREFSRQLFESYLHCLVTHSRQLGLEALRVLWKEGIFQESSLHYLLAEHTHDEIGALLIE